LLLLESAGNRVLTISSAYPPPNPKYYAQLAQADGRPVLETFNVVERLAAEEYQLIVGEGNATERC
jgi:hypothetical protein